MGVGIPPLSIGRRPSVVLKVPASKIVHQLGAALQVLAMARAHDTILQTREEGEGWWREAG